MDGYRVDWKVATEGAPRTRVLLRDAQLLAWAVHALALLLAKSKEEDHSGVVRLQHSITYGLDRFLMLYSVLLEYKATLPTNAEPTILPQITFVLSGMWNARQGMTARQGIYLTVLLSVVLSLSIYQVVGAFRAVLHSNDGTIQLPKAHTPLLNEFLAYKQ
jgi:hypothetical protein